MKDNRNYTTAGVVALVTLGAALGILAAMYYSKQKEGIGSYEGDSPLFI